MKIRVKTYHSGGDRLVRAIPTSHPQFFITPTVSPYVPGKKFPRFNRGEYSLTHKPTGLCVTSNCRSTRLLRKIAGALGGLPIKWETLTAKRAVRVAKKLPDNALEWLRGLRDTTLVMPICQRKKKAK